jgi:hypothetical protein
MAMLSESEREELLRVARSSALKEDMEYVAAHGFNPAMVGGEVDMDRLIEFLDGFNEFINHEPKPFKPMIDKYMRL